MTKEDIRLHLIERYVNGYAAVDTNMMKLKI